MRLKISILNDRVDDALAFLGSHGFDQDMDYGEDGRLGHPHVSTVTTVAGEMPLHSIEELDRIDGITSWDTELAVDPMTDAAPGEFVESQPES